MSSVVEPNAWSSPLQLVKTLRRDVYHNIDPKNPELSVEGSVVIITGAGRGMGKAIAKTWAIAGAAGIILAGRNNEDLITTSQGIKAEFPKVKLLCVPADVSSEPSVQDLYSQVLINFGKANVLINNAGVQTELAPLGVVEPSAWWKDLEINLKGTHLMIHYFLKQFKNGEAAGTIINGASGFAASIIPGVSSYGISKIANMRLTEYLDAEQPSIRAFSLNPGIVNTDMMKGPYKVFALDTPELVGAVTVYLASPRADYLRGGYVSVNWDVEEMESHADEIKNGKLTQLGFIKANLGPAGHTFG